MTKFVLIINFYNAEKTISNSLKSLINQSFKPYRVYLFDNMSKDNSEKIVKNQIRNLKNYYYIKTNHHMPLVRARNFAIKSISKSLNIKSYYFSFCDSDDLWNVNWLSKMSTFSELAYDLIICNSYFVDNKKKLKVTSGLDHFYKDVNFCPIYLNTVMFNSRLINSKKEFFDTKFELIYDIDFWISNFGKLSYISVSDNLATYIKHGGNLSVNNKYQIFFERIKMLKKYDLSLLKFFYKSILRLFR